MSEDWGFDRGRPLDRHYIEAFLAAHSDDVHGQVLEIGSDMYVRRFGGDDVERYDVLHVQHERPPVTIVGDLTDGSNLESEAYDCVILTQTLNFIYHVEAAIRTVHRILKPGGVVLATVPGIAKISRHDMDNWGEYWRFTTRSTRRVFEAGFAPDRIIVGARGNVSTAVAFLHGLSATELSRRVLEHDDPDFEVLITVRAAKAESS